MPDQDHSVAQLNEAVALFSGKSGVNALSIAEITRQIIGLLAARWEPLCDIAMDEGSEGVVSMSFGVKMDLTRRTPSGVVTLSYSQRTRDESVFQVEDPDQQRLPFEDRPAVTAVPRVPIQPVFAASQDEESIPFDAQPPQLRPPPVRRPRRPLMSSAPTTHAD
ncbi:MAG: hypothetical protein NTX27_20765 [Verrucomicrobia bacterium]|nr:hypothetical protein [Verrucomicrobiota bacterium]